MSGDRFNVGFAEHGVHVRHCYAKETHIPAGVRVGQHAHPSAHVSFLRSGTVVVDFGRRREMYRAPEWVMIPAGQQHSIEAVTDAVWYCVWPWDAIGVDVDPSMIDEALGAT